MSSVPVAPAAGNRLQYRRSRNGCLTCKRRKVRCNEHKPRCNHCERLDLPCAWKDNTSQRRLPPSNAEFHRPPESYAADSDADGPSSPPNFFDVPGSAPFTSSLSFFPENYLPDFGDFAVLHEHLPSAGRDPSSSPPTPAHSPIPSVNEEDLLLVQIPPILDPVENGPKRASVQAMLTHMASFSRMVRYSIMAFTAIQSGTRGKKAEYRRHYDKAATELSEVVQTFQGGVTGDSNGLRNVLTTIFFLTYTNLLTGHLDMAYSNLATARSVIQIAARGSLDSAEYRITSWIRLLDARAALADGKGLLLDDTCRIYPSTPGTGTPSSEFQNRDNNTSYGSYEVIYDMLCVPGIVFFQDVQTITGRITRIAHCHRSRGSVEDETEVMAVAAEISRELSSLYDRRPALMDHAVSGNISSDALAEQLASAVIRSFRTYLSNFYACYIHLHRVAHRHLDRSVAVRTAICKLKEMIHAMVNSEESISVNILWPLFLWGSEEDDVEECQWILETIRKLQNITTNAHKIADLLQEVQKRQREAKARVDIRSVCLELFEAPIAIV